MRGERDREEGSRVGTGGWRHLAAKKLSFVDEKIKIKSIKYLM